jgi:hypothetical protein
LSASMFLASACTVGDALGPLLHELEVVVDREHLAVEAVELAGARGAEAAEADHEDGSVTAQLLNQRWAFPRAASSAANGCRGHGRGESHCTNAPHEHRAGEDVDGGVGRSREPRGQADGREARDDVEEHVLDGYRDLRDRDGRHGDDRRAPRDDRGRRAARRWGCGGRTPAPRGGPSPRTTRRGRAPRASSP